MRRLIFITLILLVSLSNVRAQQPSALDITIDNNLNSLVATYEKLHASPELSYQEERTAKFIAEELRRLGYSVTEGIGSYPDATWKGYGVVGVLKNGAGPTVMIRTDLDGLPVEEKTNLPYASKVHTKNERGEEVSVMHACGHDIHMTSFLGTANVLANLKGLWQGTVILIGQPAEERGAGAKAMLKDQLYQRFGKPDYVLALHDSANIPAGKIGYCEGYALANVDSVDILVRGVGGHGAYPNSTKDPVVLAAQIVMGLQTIVSRENSPLDPTVVTVGSIHGGTKHNIIPDEVKLQLTVRTYKAEVRSRVLAAIERIAKGIALAAGIPEARMPIVKVVESESIGATYNNPELMQRLVKHWQHELGTDNVVKTDPVMGGEDFGYFSLPDNSLPGAIFWLGAVDPQKIVESKETGKPLPSLHSSEFAPLPKPTIRMGVKAMSLAILELLKR